MLLKQPDQIYEHNGMSLEVGSGICVVESGYKGHAGARMMGCDYQPWVAV